MRRPTSFQLFVITASAAALVVFSCVGALLTTAEPGHPLYSLWIVGAFGGLAIFVIGVLLSAFRLVRRAWFALLGNRTPDQQAGK